MKTPSARTSFFYFSCTSVTPCRKIRTDAVIGRTDAMIGRTDAMIGQTNALIVPAMPIVYLEP